MHHTENPTSFLVNWRLISALNWYHQGSFFRFRICETKHRSLRNLAISHANLFLGRNPSSFHRTSSRHWCLSPHMFPLWNLLPIKLAFVSFLFCALQTKIKLHLCLNIIPDELITAQTLIRPLGHKSGADPVMETYSSTLCHLAYCSRHVFSRSKSDKPLSLSPEPTGTSGALSDWLLLFWGTALLLALLEEARRQVCGAAVPEIPKSMNSKCQRSVLVVTLQTL